MNNQHKIRILLIIPRCSGGVWTVVYNLLLNIDSSCYEPYLLVLKGKTDQAVIKNLKISAFTILPEENTILDFSIKSIHSCLITIKHIVKTARVNRIDIINTHSPVPTLLGSIACFFISNIKLVASLHNDLEDFKYRAAGARGLLRRLFLNKILLPLFHCILRRCQKITTVSKLEMARLLHSCDVYNEKVVYIPPGQGSSSCDDMPQTVNAESSEVVRNVPRRIISVGTLLPVKGYEYLLDAVNLVIKKEPKVIFDIVGDGPLREELVQMSLELGIEKFVVFHGYLNDADKKIAKADIFVLPSLSEGMPCVLIEAMMMGKPIVATSVGGVPEMIEDGYNGFLVASKDSAALADKILCLLNDNNKAVQMGVNGKCLWSKMFTAEMMSDKYETVYSLCLCTN